MLGRETWSENVVMESFFCLGKIYISF